MKNGITAFVYYTNSNSPKEISDLFVFLFSKRNTFLGYYVSFVTDNENVDLVYPWFSKDLPQISYDGVDDSSLYFHVIDRTAINERQKNEFFN